MIAKYILTGGMIILLLAGKIEGNNTQKKVPYKILSDYQIKMYNLRDLLESRAELLASKGYIFENGYLKYKMNRHSWYKPSLKYSDKLLSKEEKEYLEKLNKQIEINKANRKKQLENDLKYRISRISEIKFSRLADLDSDGYMDLIAISGQKFTSITKGFDSTNEKNYYLENNKLALHAYGRNINAKIVLFKQMDGIARFVSEFDSGYFIGNGQSQIKLVIQRFSLKENPPKSHTGTLYLFDISKNSIRNIFSHNIYFATNQKNTENIVEYIYQFKNILKYPHNELIVQKKITKRTYYRTYNYYKNYKSNEYFGKKTIYYFNSLSGKYQQVK